MVDPPRTAFVTNLCPYYRRPLFRLISERLPTAFYFFSQGEEDYLGASIRHDPRGLPVRDVRRVTVAGHPLLIGLQHELRRDRYDVVIKCINGRLMVPYVFALSRRRQIPFVLWTGIWMHPRTLAHRATRRLTEAVYRGADAIVAYGDHVRRFLEDVEGVDPAKIFVAGQAIDPAPFANAQPETGDPAEILFVGQLEERKGIDVLLDAFEAIPGGSARLRVAGSGSLSGFVRSRAAKNPNIDVLGHVSQADLPGALARALCVVVPSVTTVNFREPWGLVVNEAMTSGVPVVATDAVGAAVGGLVRDGRNGLVVRERDPIALARALNRLVEDPRFAAALGATAREDVALFTYPRMADAFAAAIDYARAHSKGRP